MKPISLNEYIDAGEEFFPKYYYVLRELGEDANLADALKVMESLAALAMKKRGENGKKGQQGFLKENLKEVTEDSTK